MSIGHFAEVLDINHKSKLLVLGPSVVLNEANKVMCQTLKRFQLCHYNQL